MIEPTYGIFVPGDVIRQRLRAICEKTGCSANEALGAIVSIWMFGATAADEGNGDIRITNDVLYSVVKSTLSDSINLGQMVAAMYDSGLIGRLDGAIHINDSQEVVVPARRLEEFDQKLEKKRYLDMVRKQKRRAELKTAPPEPEPEQPKIEKNAPESAVCAQKGEENAQKPDQDAQKAEKKPEKPPKPKPEKKRYAEFVHMTESQYQKLVTDYGQEVADEMIRVLDNYKGSKGKTYKDDYRAILMWVVNYIREHEPQMLKKAQEVQWHDENPFG